ncbi:MAG TPA: hypothetical protein VJG49_04590 [Candidatus Nanoarchaeia archaeon]|nr:hypothetical protein [Candidatus Nanoarchaeia archaeon]
MPTIVNRNKDIFSMKRSLQRIGDFYSSQGYKGNELRKILSKDRDYQKLLQERKQKLTKNILLTKTEKKKYVMSIDEDCEILSKVKQLERLNLNKEEKFLIEFIRTQLEHDWRKWLIKELDKILLNKKTPLKYKRSPQN